MKGLVMCSRPAEANIYWHFVQKADKIPKTHTFWGLKSVSDISSAYLLLNCGALRAALRPYCASFWAVFPWYSGLFRLSASQLSGVRTIKNGLFSFSDRLMKRTIYYPKQLLWFIVLHFCINVHSCFAVFMSGKVLYCLWITSASAHAGVCTNSAVFRPLWWL